MHIANYMYVYSCNDYLTLPNLFVAPSEPQQLEVVTITSTSVTLQWMPPKYPNGIITQYSIHYDKIDIDDFGNKFSDKMIGTIERLSPDTVYLLKMKAYTRIGPGPPVSLTVGTCKLMNSGVQIIFMMEVILLFHFKFF